MKILGRFKKCANAQQGFTLVELLTAIVVTSIIIIGITSASFQLIKMNTTSINRQTAISRIESSVNSITRDAQMAQLVPTATANHIEFDWNEWNDVSNTTIQKTVIYDSSTGNLTRKLNAGTAVLTGTKITIQNCSWNATAKVLTLEIRGYLDATHFITRSLQISPRPAQ
jgi:prepilin-type N-terminal cleavage/methylation domain-containing protein